MQKVKLGDLVKFKNEYGLVIDKIKFNGETKTVKVFLINATNHGERIAELSNDDISIIGHSYDFDNLRKGLPKKVIAIDKELR